MRSAVEGSQVIDEHLQLPSRGEAIHDAELTKAVQLPQHQRRRGIEFPRVGKEVGRLVALPSLVRIDAEIGEQAFRVDHKSVFPLAVAALVHLEECPRVGIQLFDPLTRRRAHEKVQNLVGLFDGCSRLRGGLRSEPDACADDRQAPASHRISLLSLDAVDSGCVAGCGSADTQVDIHFSAVF